MSGLSLWQLVGNTPLIRINSLSKLLGCEILGKAEFLNPGGSIKDRAAKSIIESAEQTGSLQPGGTIVEGTAGNTGIGLATLAIPRGYKVVLTMPDNQAKEKSSLLQALGVKVIEVPPVPFANENHFYHQAKRIAEQNPGYFWANQFENLANFKAHVETTGPEIFKQTNGKIDFFVSAAGTGGTIGGVSHFLKSNSPETKIILADPMGSGLFSYFKSNELKSQGSSITEGIGIMRLTANFKQAQVDDAIQITDQQMIDMLYFISENEGLPLGTSAALNLAAVFKFAQNYKNSGKCFVTMLCDHGTRYQSKIFSSEWLKEKNLLPQPSTIR